MAMLPSLSLFNDGRRENVRIETAVGESILLTKAETKRMLFEFLNEDLELLTDENVKDTKKKILTLINDKMDGFELEFFDFINDKINKIAENIILKSTNL